MLWDIVYNFFITYIFPLESTIDVNWTDDNSFDVMGLNIIKAYDINENFYLSLPAYLSLIATIISMVVIVLICCALIKKIYNMCAHIIG